MNQKTETLNRIKANKQQKTTITPQCSLKLWIKKTPIASSQHYNMTIEWNGNYSKKL